MPNVWFGRATRIPKPSRRVAFERSSLLSWREPVAEHPIEHPLNRPPAVGREDEQAARREMVGEELQECRPAVAIQVREQRAAPDQVERSGRASGPARPRGSRAARRRTAAAQKSTPSRIEVTDSEVGVGKGRAQHPADPPVPARHVEDRGGRQLRGRQRPLDALERGEADLEIPRLSGRPHVIIAARSRCCTESSPLLLARTVLRRAHRRPRASATSGRALRETSRSVPAQLARGQRDVEHVHRHVERTPLDVAAGNRTSEQRARWPRANR